MRGRKNGDLAVAKGRESLRSNNVRVVNSRAQVKLYLLVTKKTLTHINFIISY